MNSEERAVEVQVRLLEPHRVTRRYVVFGKVVEYVRKFGCDHIIMTGWNVGYSTLEFVRYLRRELGVSPTIAVSKIPNEPWITHGIEECGKLIYFENLHAKAIYIIIDGEVLVIETSSNPVYGDLIEHYSIQQLPKKLFLNRVSPIRRLFKGIFEGDDI